MTIISVQFIIFSVTLVCLYFLLPKKYQWKILLVFSFLFYLLAGWKGLAFVLITIITQYILAIRLDSQNKAFEEEVTEKALKGKEKAELKKKYVTVKRRYVLISVLINIGILCVVKYTNFVIDNMNTIFSYSNITNLRHIDMIVPLGISFYTFQSLGYVIDVYRGKVKAERNILKFALFVSFFPCIIQGPIGRYGELAEQLFSEHEYDYKRVMFGIQRMLWGYIKKLVIAERVAVIVNEVFSNYLDKEYSGFIVFIAALLYGIQIYADFSGGMDIVCGLSEILGISLTENFKQPYMAKSVAEFWQRWHITLGAWMRNYLFYPISLSSAFNKLGKQCKKIFGDKAGRVIPTSLASFIVFFIVGVWHGANWKYIAYGIYNAYFVSTGTLLEDVYEKLRKQFHIDVTRNLWKLFQMLRTLLIVTFGRYLSRGDSLSHAWGLLKATIRECNPWVLFDGSLYKLGLSEKNFRFMLLTIIGLIMVDWIKEKGIRIREVIAQQNIVPRWMIYYAALFGLIIFGMYGVGYNAVSFIYQQF